MRHKLLLPSDPYKQAYLWIATLHGQFFAANLFFSSHNAFEAAGGKLAPEDILLPVRVPIDFDDWDYIPENY